jgi:hypothetical protein
VNVKCVRCSHELRVGAAFCGECGEPQPGIVETPEAIARYREVLARFVAEGGLDDAKHAQLETVRVKLGIQLATHAKLYAELEPTLPPPPSMKLAIDIATLRHLAAGARGLVRWRIENEGQLALDKLELHAMLSGEALPVAEAVTLFPGRAVVLATSITPQLAGFYELSGELRARDLMGEVSRYRFDAIHVRAAGDAAQINVINIDQSNARVVDNSRSTFGVADSGGLVGEGEWHPVPLVAIREPAQRTSTTNERRVEFAVTTDKATYQVTTRLARGDIATVYGGHVRGTSTRVVVKIADQTSDNDLMQHEARVLGLLLAEPDRTTIHFAPPRDQFRTSDGRLGSVFDHLDGFDLTSVRDRCRRRGEPGLPPRHLIWVLRRALAALGWAHKNGILHGNLDPAHILVRPHDHMLWVVDWCWAVVNPAQTGQGFKALNETYSPPEVSARGKPTPASDIYALGKCAIHLVGGDPASKTLPEMDHRLARFIKYLCVESQGGRPQDAWELYLQIDKLREQIWGKHEFIPLEL